MVIGIVMLAVVTTLVVAGVMVGVPLVIFTVLGKLDKEMGSSYEW